MVRRIVTWGVVGALVLFGVMQLVPYGRAHTNPRVVAEPAWDSSQTRQLAIRACYDCHSNETQWPWYTNVAPISWLAQRDVDEGRAKLNFSEWNRQQKEAKDAAEKLQEGEMPPWFYWLPRGGSRLTYAEQDALIRGLQATFGSKSH